jgi:hypothetical protein
VAAGIGRKWIVIGHVEGLNLSTGLQNLQNPGDFGDLFIGSYTAPHQVLCIYGRLSPLGELRGGPS